MPFCVPSLPDRYERRNNSRNPEWFSVAAARNNCAWPSGGIPFHPHPNSLSPHHLPFRRNPKSRRHTVVGPFSLLAVKPMLKKGWDGMGSRGGEGGEGGEQSER